MMRGEEGDFASRGSYRKMVLIGAGGFCAGVVLGVAWEAGRCDGTGSSADYNPFAAYWAFRRAQYNPLLNFFAPESAAHAGAGATALLGAAGTYLKVAKTHGITPGYVQ